MSKLSELKPVEQQVTQWLSRMGWELLTPEEMKDIICITTDRCKLK